MPFALSTDAPRSDGVASLRVGVERGMVAAVAVVAVLLVLLAVPEFAADHAPVTSPLVVVSLCLAAVLVAGAPLAIMRRPEPARAWLWVTITAYGTLLALEPFILRDPLPTGSTPWLLALSLIAFGATAIADRSPVRAGVICGGLDAATALVYAGRIPTSHSIIDAVGLGLLSMCLIVGVRALRSRAARADQAERDAQLLFEKQHRQMAIEAERVHTDALLHDTVLATLLAAAGQEASEWTTSMARAALHIISTTDDHPVAQPSTVPLGFVLASAEQEFAPFREHARIDMADAHHVLLPPDIADALVSATLQALTNSIKHAGPSAQRAAVATPLEDGGVRISITDDGAGFDLTRVDQERIGVRVSILERVRLAGAHAEILSSPGNGTSVLLKWRGATGEQPSDRRPGIPRINLIPRRQLSRILGVLIAMAILTAISEAALFSRAVGPVIAAVLGLIILPALLKGARTGAMHPRTAWGIAAVGLLLCGTATIGLDPTTVDSGSIYWYTCGVLAGAVMVWMTGHKAPPIIAIAFQLTQITLWAGPTGTIRLGFAAEIVLVIAGLMMHRAIARISTAADVATITQHALTVQQAELDAFHLERQQRLHHASQRVAPMLLHIITHHGKLDTAARAECRVLEQAIRDEIRGRALLNDAIRAIVTTHRRRGAYVQVLDDGGLDNMPPATLNALLNDAADQLQPLQSSRIVIRTGQPDSDTAITIVASTLDETAAALGLDTDDNVDLWTSIPRPSNTTLAA
jgi:signal transduction histidine kinase